MSDRDNPRGLDSLRLLSDEELARVAASGDERAARVLLERFEEPLYRYTVALVRDPDLAREATWSALFEAARAVRAGEHAEPIAPWIFRVAHTAADVAGGRPEGGGDDEAAARAAAAGDPDRERLERLLAGLEALPARDRSSLLLRELVGLEYVGIATVTGARAAAARQSVYRARQALEGDAALPTAHCAEIQAAMSKAETGLRERRSIALHLETCAVCEGFAAALDQRPEDLRTLFPPPLEPLAAELLPPLPPVAAGADTLGGGAGAAPITRAGGGRDRGGRRRGALVPLVLVLLLAGAAIATAIALNDNGGGKHGRATAAGGAQARGAAEGGGSGKSSSASGSKSKARGGKSGAKSGGAKSKGTKPRTAAHPGSGKSKASKGAAAGGAAAGGTAPSEPKGNAPSEPKGGTPSEPNGTGPSEPNGTGSSGAGGDQAKRGAPCRSGPAAAPAAQSGYGNQAGVVQAAVEPCPRGSQQEAAGLAHTGLDIALVIACGALLLALGVSLRRLGAQA